MAQVFEAVRLLSSNPRWALGSRVLAGVVGGYAFSSLFTIAVSLLLPKLGVQQAQGVLAASMASCFVYAAVIVAVFHARSATRAWQGLLLASVFPSFSLLLLPGTLQ